MFAHIEIILVSLFEKHLILTTYGLALIDFVVILEVRVKGSVSFAER